MNYLQKVIELGLPKGESIFQTMEHHCPFKLLNLDTTEYEREIACDTDCLECWTKEREGLK
jgi:hypothetical protein